MIEKSGGIARWIAEKKRTMAARSNGFDRLKSAKGDCVPL